MEPKSVEQKLFEERVRVGQVWLYKAYESRSDKYYVTALPERWGYEMRLQEFVGGVPIGTGFNHPSDRFLKEFVLDKSDAQKITLHAERLIMASGTLGFENEVYDALGEIDI